MVSGIRVAEKGVSEQLRSAGRLVWQNVLAITELLQPVLNVLMSRSAIKGSPLGSVLGERRPPPRTAPPLPPQPQAK